MAAEAQQEMLLNRTKKLVITAPILIATALGTAAIATAAGTAHVIATNESTKVLTTEKAHRVEDINNGVFNNKINLGLIGEVANDIDSVRKTAAHSSHAFTNLNQAIQLNNEFNYLVSMITIIPLSDFSEKCQDRLILKTTLVPIVNHRTRWEVVSENGRLYQKMEISPPDVYIFHTCARFCGGKNSTNLASVAVIQISWPSRGRW